ncbi:MAG: hypothetical protein MN733_09670 [Nitrososphaera sp.]|nr:hypothetical protein [Nitrososphaera sp.]
MTVLVDFSGDNTSITAGGGETTLASSTNNGVFQVAVDTENLANGDVLEIKIYTKVLAGSTKHLVFHAIYAHAQAELVKISPPIMSPNYFEATLTLTGTTRTFDWAIMRS